MKKRILIFALLGFIPLLSQAQSQSDTSDTGWTLEISAGEKYSYIKWYGPIPTRKKPLIAVWLEDSEGRLLKTLYITEKAAENSWLGKAEERPESLPVYLHSKATVNIQESIDSISAASKGKGPDNRSFPGDFPLETFRVMAEVNISYDYNDYYTKELTDVNGQPSLVFQTDWIAGQKTFSLKPVGTGSMKGSNGKIDTDLSHLTSALELLEGITLSW